MTLASGLVYRVYHRCGLFVEPFGAAPHANGATISIAKKLAPLGGRQANNRGDMPRGFHTQSIWPHQNASTGVLVVEIRHLVPCFRALSGEDAGVSNVRQCGTMSASPRKRPFKA